MSQAWTLAEAMQRTGVLQAGHFLLSSGRHSAQYLQCARLLQYPTDASHTGESLAKLFHDKKIDVVVGPALGGVIIAYEVARAIGVRCLFTERKEGQMELRRGFTMQPGECVLVIEDVVTTGGSVQEVVTLLEQMEAEIVGVGSIVDRSGGHTPFHYPYRALTAMQVQSYLPAECPLCKRGIPAIKPGSRAIPMSG
jgi:orotate phosphoribosyltransferase